MGIWAVYAPELQHRGQPATTMEIGLQNPMETCLESRVTDVVQRSSRAAFDPLLRFRVQAMASNSLDAHGDLHAAVAVDSRNQRPVHDFGAVLPWHVRLPPTSA